MGLGKKYNRDEVSRCQFLANIISFMHGANIAVLWRRVVFCLTVVAVKGWSCKPRADISVVL